MCPAAMSTMSHDLRSAVAVNTQTRGAFPRPNEQNPGRAHVGLALEVTMMSWATCPPSWLVGRAPPAPPTTPGEASRAACSLHPPSPLSSWAACQKSSRPNTEFSCLSPTDRHRKLKHSRRTSEIDGRSAADAFAAAAPVAPLFLD